ncbi:MAG TPA: hypothetical protein VGX92_14430 [Pyrinomonadaceae bacterium]|jgi:hypothetical protein|nr:hypothetical protein [Pyrinomonadaceae bacterium]
MSDDYLWDRSGESDPEIERLESVLGGLRHQPRPLELPVARPRPKLFHGLAAAAAVMMIVAGGLWLASRPSIDDAENPPRLVIARPVPYLLSELKEPKPSIAPVIKGTESGARATLAGSTQAGVLRRPRRTNEERESANILRVARRGAPSQSDQELMREGEKARDQLMLGLRFASSQLNRVQREIQINKESGPAS